jgi:hypothetical protein
MHKPRKKRSLLSNWEDPTSLLIAKMGKDLKNKTMAIEYAFSKI